MKFLTYHRTDRDGAGRWSAAILRSLAACLITAGPALATTGGPPRPPDADSTVSGGDETVGTLPVVNRNAIKLPFVRDWRGTQPAFYLQGSASDLSIAILGARGRGFVSVEVMDPAAQTLRLAFHGNVMVAVDRGLAAGLPIEFGLAVPGSSGSARATMSFGQDAPRLMRLRPGLLRFPVSTMSVLGDLDESPLHVLVSGVTPRRSTHTISASADLLILRQTD